MITSSNRRKSSFWIRKLRLSQHPEGGFYRETYRADVAINFRIGTKHTSPKDLVEVRSISSTIYYLLEGFQKSMFHRMKNADEIWHFYTGSSLTIYVIDEVTRVISDLKLGNKIEKVWSKTERLIFLCIGRLYCHSRIFICRF